MTRYPFYTKSGAGPLFFLGTNREPVIRIPVPQRYVSISNAAADTAEPGPVVVRFLWRITKPFEEFAYEAERDLTPAEFEALYQPT